MNERVDTGDVVMNGIINTNTVSVILPPGLVMLFTEAVSEYAALHRETPMDCCRAVEIAILQLGLRALREQLKNDRVLGERMGWAKEEESGT